MRILQLSLQEAMHIMKALTNENRVEMMKHLMNGPKNVNELADLLNIPFSTAAANVKILENTEMIKTEIIPGRGSQKVSSSRYDRIVIELAKESDVDDMLTFELEVGEYVQCDVEPTCGLLSEEGIIHILDDPRSFYEPERKNAQLIWFRSGFIEYHFPNRIPYGSSANELSFSVEMCSEAPYYKEDWPSDITCWINDIEIGAWQSPSDFGGKRGFLTPSWWETSSTQYGLLKYWTINHEGSFIDGTKISNTTIDELRLLGKPYISLKFGIKKDSQNQGGLNLFGSKFGNYEQGIIMKVHFSPTK